MNIARKAKKTELEETKLDSKLTKLKT